MKKQHFVAVVVSLVLAALLMPNPAMAADQIFKFTSDSASAYFYNASADNCVFTNAYVTASEQATRTPPPKGQPSTSSQVYVAVDYYNQCTGESRYGSSVADLAPSAFVVTKTSATLNATVTVFNGISDPFDVFINLSWSATGPASRSVYTSKISSKHCKSSSRYDGTVYPASTTGSISDGTINFTPASPTYADYGSVKSGSLVIYCNP